MRYFTEDIIAGALAHAVAESVCLLYQRSLRWHGIGRFYRYRNHRRSCLRWATVPATRSLPVITHGSPPVSQKDFWSTIE